MAISAVKVHEFDHHDYKQLEHLKNDAEPEETEHHHEVEHKHAISHQSVKFHHFHPVPVYVKKEDQHLLKKPIEIGGTKQKLKILHPKTEHNHNYGLVLEEHSESHVHDHGHYEQLQNDDHYEHYQHHE
ncbi:histidine-rich glycoprotein isoform X2 [Teleopsis dalmanni]|nr:histidine-rich glycoprotein isoform X2 [Teleopsis dalmanni]